ncbi:MAG: DUF2279 domain-containing protein [Cytophagales bacterium]|nr:DUF2279 domain-containing protein [Cytophaga sp.]
MSLLKKYITLLFFLIMLCMQSYAQDTVTFKKQRFIPLVAVAGAAYIGGMAGLYQLWYQGYPSEHFHFFNDNDQWMQMDKSGHLFTCFQIGRYSIAALKWTGTNRKKAIWYGAATGLLFQTNIEIFDGFSSEWGFSVGDMTANILGSTLLVSQYLAWNEIRIIPKFSFHTTEYATVHPELLGNSFGQQLFKDYNGQTYWLSFNIRKLTQQKFFWPEWLCVSAGYSAEEMIRGTTAESNAEGYYPYRQFYLSLDVDFQSIKTRSKFLKSVFYAVNMIKVPMPAVEFSEHGVKMYGIYF